MFCRNCGRDIGTQNRCPFCGYGARQEESIAMVNNMRTEINLPRTEIRKLSTNNGMASAGLVMSIFSFLPIPFMILALIFNIKASFRCKPYRSGTARCILAWIFFFLWIGLYSALIYYFVAYI